MNIKVTTPRAILAAGVSACVVAPFAIAAGEGQPTRGGARNPSPNASQAYTRETQIIANTRSYGTRQSNKSDNGGGAVYGCRSKEGGTPARNEPCLRATNLNRGLAFEYESRGGLVGTITAPGGDNAKPFTTNATGVATGLNADEVDGRSADEFLLATGKAADADKLDGVESSAYLNLFAVVSAAGNVTGGRGATGATVNDATNTFTVTFDRDINACSFVATESGTTSSGVSFAATATAARTVTVDEDNDADPPVPFNLQVSC